MHEHQQQLTQKARTPDKSLPSPPASPFSDSLSSSATKTKKRLGGITSVFSSLLSLGRRSHKRSVTSPTDLPRPGIIETLEAQVTRRPQPEDPSGDAAVLPKGRRLRLRSTPRHNTAPSESKSFFQRRPSLAERSRRVARSPPEPTSPIAFLEENVTHSLGTPTPVSLQSNIILHSAREVDLLLTEFAISRPAPQPQELTQTYFHSPPDIPTSTSNPISINSDGSNHGHRTGLASTFGYGRSSSHLDIALPSSAATFGMPSSTSLAWGYSNGRAAVTHDDSEDEEPDDLSLNHSLEYEMDSPDLRPSLGAPMSFTGSFMTLPPPNIPGPSNGKGTYVYNQQASPQPGRTRKSSASERAARRMPSLGQEGMALVASATTSAVRSRKPSETSVITSKPSTSALGPPRSRPSMSALPTSRSTTIPRPDPLEPGSPTSPLPRAKRGPLAISKARSYSENINRSSSSRPRTSSPPPPLPASRNRPQA